MTSINRKDALPLPRKALCLALAAAFAASAWAEEDDEVARLIKPDSSITLGVGHVSGDNQRFGMYNGLNKEGTYGIGSFSIIRRDDETGTWIRAQGRNLGLSNGELRLEHERQGQWRYFIEIDQLTRNTPYEVHSRLLGVGSNNLSVQSGGTMGVLPQFQTERLGSKLGFSHYFSPELEIKLLFQNTDKKGERLFGRGAGTAQEFLAEPIDSSTRQFDAVLNYTGDRLQLSGGYYGSWYLNNNSQLNVAGGNTAAFSPTNAIGAASVALPFPYLALPPDNSAHQLHLTGGYQFTDKTRASFKLAYTRALQNDDFIAVPTASGAGVPAGFLSNRSGRSDLGGRLDTTLANFSLTSRPIQNLSLQGSLRYENRDDKTTVVKYVSDNLTSPTRNAQTTDGFNEPRSLKIMSAKVEASYLLPQGFRLTGGAELEQKEHSMAGVRVVGYRDKTDEAIYRLELSRAIAETINGSIAYIHSDRSGSAYRTLQTWNSVTQTFNAGESYSNRVQPIYLADRDRDKIRLFADWTPIDALTLQLAVEDAKDSYGAGRGVPDIGPRSGDATLYSLDATWTLNDKWRVNGWTSLTRTRMNQATGNSAATYWTAALNNETDAFGLGLRGKLTALVDVGADAVLSKDVSRYKLGGNANSALPDIRYDQTTLKFFGRYALNKDANLRLDYVFDHRKTNDWTWDGTGVSGTAGRPYVYADGTFLYQRPEDKVHFIGVSANYSFR